MMIQQWILIFLAASRGDVPTQKCFAFTAQRPVPPTLLLPRQQKQQRTDVILYASVGGGTPPPSNNGKGNSEWDEFLNPSAEESENLMKAREFMSENSLPLSYDISPDLDDDDDEDENIVRPNSSALVASNIFAGGLSPEILARNPYMAVVSKISPSDLISKFTSTAHPGVQNAVRSTILGLIGGLPKMAFETSTITTGQKLASLMFQLQMTGYMFKVRLSIIEGEQRMLG
jgi:Protein of unknown function (DUF760)